MTIQIRHLVCSVHCTVLRLHNELKIFSGLTILVCCIWSEAYIKILVKLVHDL